MDDVLVIGSCIKAVKAAKQLQEMNELGVAKSFLRVKFMLTVRVLPSVRSTTLNKF